jgi:hypothetical protein
MGIVFKTSSLEELKIRFRAMYRFGRNEGLNEDINDLSPGIPLSNMRLMAQSGLTDSLRPKIWRLLLETDLVDCLDTHMKRTTHVLNQRVNKYNLLLDRVLQLESKHCQNDDQYFVFEDIVRDVLLYWSRDEWIPTKLREMRYPIADIDDLGNRYNPICPIWGLSLYVMPLCYLYDNPEEVYMLFRQWYVQFIYQLHVPTSKGDSILYLSILFENLMKQHDMDLYAFLVLELKLNPLEIAFKWILYAFVGVLESDQVLQLWDRIVGFNSLELLPLTAAALFSFRKESLMRCQNRDEAMVRFLDIGMLQ